MTTVVPEPVTVAALYVERGGVYWNLPGVDPWDEERDARKYAGPHPVVAHPPCERWGRYANGGPGFRGAVRPTPGDDGGCFAAAFSAAYLFGGVIEHPADSLAWRVMDLNRPPRSGGWIRAGRAGFWTCCVEQGNYGHRARKATWLLANVDNPPPLIWRPTTRVCPVCCASAIAAGLVAEGSLCQSCNPNPKRRASRTGICQRMSRKQRRSTPPAFASLLLSIARSVRR